jgi:hypothetical protein
VSANPNTFTKCEHTLVVTHVHRGCSYISLRHFLYIYTYIYILLKENKGADRSDETTRKKT